MHRYSWYSFLLCAGLMLATQFLYYPRWAKPHTEATLSWDVSGYYLYLPAALIYQDMKSLAFFPEVEQKYHPGPGMGQAFKHEGSGNYVMKYSSGQALQFLPWFTLAHFAAPILGYPQDGFSMPYQAAISWGSMLIALLGLALARKNLLHFFSDKAVAFALMTMVWGTNYLNYTAIDGAMTHNWLFTLYNLLIYATIRYYRKPSLWGAALIGLCCGWATLTRPTEIISLLIPIFWGVGNWAQLVARLRFFWMHTLHWIVAGLKFAAFVGLQAIYWKWASGEWIVYSYQDQGFDWLHPHFKDVFFSFRAGWLIYSPMMVLAILGLFAFYRRQKSLFPTITLFLFCFTYITCAWSIWWYGGSLGARAMVQSYAFWLFPLAAFGEWVVTKKWAALVIAGLCGFFIWHNLWWTHQAHRGGLFIAEQMTNRYFWKVYGRETAEKEWLLFLDKADNFRGTERKNFALVWKNDFETDTMGTTTSQAITGTHSLLIDAQHPYSPKYTFKKPGNGQYWLRVGFNINSTPTEYETWKMTQVIVRFMNGDKIAKENMIRPQRLLSTNATQQIFFDIKQPKKPWETVDIQCWNPGSATTVRIDDLAVEKFEE